MVGCPAESSTGFFRGWRAVEILDAARIPVTAPISCSHAEREADLGVEAAEGAPVARDRGRDARLPSSFRDGRPGTRTSARGHQGDWADDLDGGPRPENSLRRLHWRSAPAGHPSTRAASGHGVALYDNSSVFESGRRRADPPPDRPGGRDCRQGVRRGGAASPRQPHVAHGVCWLLSTKGQEPACSVWSFLGLSFGSQSLYPAGLFHHCAGLWFLVCCGFRRS